MPSSSSSSGTCDSPAWRQRGVISPLGHCWMWERPSPPPPAAHCMSVDPRASFARLGTPPGEGVMSCVTARRANHSKPVQPSREKYSASRSPQITPTTPAIPRPQEGRIAIVTDVGCGERWPRHRRARKKSSQGELAHERRPRADERRLKRTAKPCGSGTRCWCQAGGDVASPTGLRRVFNPPVTEARGIRLRGATVLM